MKSIKPGRGPSEHSMISSIFTAVFGVIWTIASIVMTSGGGIISFIFPLFGVLFVAEAIYNAVVCYKNAKRKDRMSLYDIVDEKEERDPWDPRYRDPVSHTQNLDDSQCFYCPYCGQRVEKDHKFCKKCGRQLK